MTDQIDPETLARAQRALVKWMNKRALRRRDRIKSVDGWLVYPVEEFLIFSSPGGYTNRLYLVGDGVVRSFSYADETQEYAVAAARAERDGTEPPPPPGPAITSEEWNAFLKE